MNTSQPTAGPTVDTSSAGTQPGGEVNPPAENSPAADGPPRANSSATNPDRVRRKPRDETRRREKQSIRRTIAKYVELADLDNDRAELLGALIGCKPDPVTLTVEILSAPTGSGGGNNSALRDLHELRDADDMQAGILAASWDRTRLRAVHQLLVGLDTDVPEKLPSNDVKAAMAVATAVKGMHAGQIDALASVSGLMTKQ